MLEMRMQLRLDLMLSGIFALLFLLTSLRASAQVIEIILLVTLLGLAFMNHSISPKILSQRLRWVMYAMFGVFVAYLLGFLYSQGLTGKLAPMNPYINYLACGIILWFLFRSPYQLCSKIIFYAIAFAAIINGIFAFYQALVLDYVRVFGAIGIFKFSQTNGALCLILLSLFLYAQNKRDKIFYALGVFFSFAVVVLCVTRGTYVGLILAFLILGLLLLCFDRKRFKDFIFLFFLCFIALGLIMVVNGKKDFFNAAAFTQDMEQYDRGNVNTSNGLRIEMWKEAFAMFRISPIFGMNSKLVDKHLEEIIALSKTKRRFNELTGIENPSRQDIIKAIAQNRHNQFFDTLATAGLVGIVALFFLIFAFLRAFLSGSKTWSKDEMKISFAGAAVLFFFGGCCIGDVPFSSNFMIPFMMLTMIVLLKLKTQERAFAN